MPRRRPHLDPLEPLDAARADVARHDHAQRRAVHRLQRLAVHRPGEQDLGPARLVERDRAAEPLRRRGLLRRGPRRRSRRARRPGSGPASASTSASATPVQVAVPVAPGPHGASPGMSRTATRPARRLPAHCSVAVTVALAAAPRCSVSSDSSSSRPTSPCTRSRHSRSIDLRHRAVPAHVERVGRRHRGLGQRGEPGLGVERLLLVDDHVRALSVATHPASVWKRRRRSALETTERLDRTIARLAITGLSRPMAASGIAATL